MWRELLLSLLGAAVALLIVCVGVPLMVIGAAWIKRRQTAWRDDSAWHL